MHPNTGDALLRQLDHVGSVGVSTLRRSLKSDAALLSTLACSIASICLSASARFSDCCLSRRGDVTGQTITIAGAVSVPLLPPSPAFKPESINPLFEIA